MRLVADITIATFILCAIAHFLIAMSPKKMTSGYNTNTKDDKEVEEQVEETAEQTVANPDIPCGSGEDPLVAQITASLDEMYWKRCAKSWNTTRMRRTS